MFQFERKKLFFSHLNIYFDDMALAVIIFHWMYYLIAVERGRKETFRLSIRNYISLASCILAAVLGNFYPVAALIIVATFTYWWIVLEKK